MPRSTSSMVYGNIYQADRPSRFDCTGMVALGMPLTWAPLTISFYGAFFPYDRTVRPVASTIR